MAEELTPEVQAERDRVIAQMNAQQGLSDETVVQVDYFGVPTIHTVVLPDGNSSVQHKTLKEGDRRKYLSATSSDIVMKRGTNEARFKMAAGEERYQLLKLAICGWNLSKGGQKFPYNDANKEQLLQQMDPDILDLIEKDVRAKNKWLRSEASIEDLEATIKDLQEQLEEKRREEEGKALSAS